MNKNNNKLKVIIRQKSEKMKEIIKKEMARIKYKQRAKQTIEIPKQ